MPSPLCFVLMPFGKKGDPMGGEPIEFDRIYEESIRPAIDAAGLEPIRADEERTGGIIHKAMFERLLLCDYAVADLTAANANVFYELGVRHAVRPATTLVLFGKGHTPPFDVSYVRGMPYDLGAKNRFPPEAAAALRNGLTEQLQKLHAGTHAGTVTDSPLFQLLTEYRAPDLERLKTDTFRERVDYAVGKKRELAAARRSKEPAILARIQAGLGDLRDVEAGVLIDLYLSYRALSAHGKMVELYDHLPVTLQRSVLVREQLGFALNRLGRREEAISVLEKVLEDQGPSSETYGLLGRVYKDLWTEAQREAHNPRAKGYLARAIDHYVRGFEADFRDAYPGINAVTLLDIQGTPQARAKKAELLPVVRFAASRRLARNGPDYWDHATMLELAVLEGNEAAAREALAQALITARESWELRSTANNLSLIREARRARGEAEPWLDEIVTALTEDQRGAASFT